MLRIREVFDFLTYDLIFHFIKNVITFFNQKIVTTHILYQNQKKKNCHFKYPSYLRYLISLNILKSNIRFFHVRTI